MAKNILILVEGAKTDVKLMEKLLNLFELDLQYNIVSYNTNIYTLYNKIFQNNDEDSIDLLQLLKENDKNNSDIFDKKYSDILLVFDLDPQDPLYTDEKILKLSNYFNESTDNGKLYLNYPMVESFYHMKSIPDDEYSKRTFNKSNLSKYKSTVGKECRDGDYRKFAKDKQEMIEVILQNLSKASNILGLKSLDFYPDLHSILEKQISQINYCNEIFVLCTCIFFISDYNKSLLLPLNL